MSIASGWPCHSFVFVVANLICRQNAILKNAISGAAIKDATSRVGLDRNRVEVSLPSIRMSSRRDICFAVLSAPFLTPKTSNAAIWDKENITALFDGDSVVQPQFDPNARDDITYPDWLEGVWKCSSEMTRFSTPLGTRFLGKLSSPFLRPKQAFH